MNVGYFICENVIIFRFPAPYIIYVECIDVTDVSTSPLVPKSLGASINLNHVQSMQQMNGHHSSPLRHVKSEERLNDAASNRYVRPLVEFDLMNHNNEIQYFHF